LLDAPLEAIEAIDGIGPVIAGSLGAWLGDPENVALLTRLRANGCALNEPDTTGGVAQTLAGKAVVVTGAVAGYTREGAEAAIVQRGGTSPGSVSKKTYCVVVGEAPGASKLTKATDLAIPMVAADRFAELLASGSFEGLVAGG
jgi:DNA ligase (NAD+)